MRAWLIALAALLPAAARAKAIDRGHSPDRGAGRHGRPQDRRPATDVTYPQQQQETPP